MALQADLSAPEIVLERQGLRVEYGLKDGNDFYRIISQLWWETDKHPNSARKEICDFELEKMPDYFQLFLPSTEKLSQAKNQSIKKLFEDSIADVKKNKEPPSERELYASAQRLQVEIYVFAQCDKTGTGWYDGDWDWFLFSPIVKDQIETSDKYLTFLRFRQPNGRYDFAKISYDPDDPNNVIGEETNRSITLRPHCRDKESVPHFRCLNIGFSNTEIWLYQSQYEHIMDLGGDVGSPDTINWDREFLERVDSLFRCFSKELYDTDEYFHLVREAICNFEIHEDYIEVFMQFASVEDSSLETTDKQRIKDFKQNVNAVRSGSKQSGKAEIFAMASLLHVPIFVYTSSKTWEMYPPLTCGIEGTSSYVSLLESEDHLYERLVPRRYPCNCMVTPPRINGNVRNLQQDLSRIILEFVGKEKTCCSRGRHCRHGHLDHIASELNMDNAVRDNEERFKYVFPGDKLSNVISLLEKEDRILNQIGQGGGSISDCLCMEIFGDEGKSKEVQAKFDALANKNAEQQTTDLEDISLMAVHDADDTASTMSDVGYMIQKASSWIRLPIYLLTEVGEEDSGRFKWERYLPKETKPDCRHYITLYYHRDEKLFDRIIPLTGCNCQLVPPVSIFRDECQDNFESLKSVDDPHRPMVEFLLEDIPDDMLTEETRNIPVCNLYKETYQVMKRPDMSNRVIDQVDLDCNSFYRCLSKEIFGKDDKYMYIREKVYAEMSDLPGALEDILYSSVNDCTKDMTKKQKTEELRKRIQRVKMDYDADDVEILVAATLFQTPIYVLYLETNGSSRWKEFLQLKRKPKPNKDPKRISVCRQTDRSDKYYVTLFRSSADHFDRVVPANDVCNCLSDKPEVPGNYRFVYDTQMTANENDILQLMREVEACTCRVTIALNNWNDTNFAMQQLCDTIVNQLEGNRKKVNVATITGSATGMVGAALAIAGLIAGPVTLGASLGLTIAGGVIGGVGGVTTISAKITEAVLVRKTLSQLNECKRVFKERSDILKKRVEELHSKIGYLDDKAKDFIQKSEITAFDPALLLSAGAMLRAAKEFYVIPVAMLRFSIRSATIASAVLGPLTVALDIGFMAYAVYNLSKGSKTDVSENLRRMSSMLKASRIQMLTWAYGNAKTRY